MHQVSAGVDNAANPTQPDILAGGIFRLTIDLHNVFRENLTSAHQQADYSKANAMHRKRATTYTVLKLVLLLGEKSHGLVDSVCSAELIHQLVHPAPALLELEDASQSGTPFLLALRFEMGLVEMIKERFDEVAFVDMLRCYYELLFKEGLKGVYLPSQRSPTLAGAWGAGTLDGLTPHLPTSQLCQSLSSQS